MNENLPSSIFVANCQQTYNLQDEFGLEDDYDMIKTGWIFLIPQDFILRLFVFGGIIKKGWKEG